MTKVKGLALALMMILCLSTGVLGESPEEAWLAMPVSGTGGEATSTPKSGNEDPGTIIISAAGDCTLGGDAKAGDNRFAQYARKNGYAYFFSNVAEIFAGDDLTIVNLEGPLTGAHRRRAGRTFNFRGLPEYAQILALGNVDAATVANNHRMDFGSAGARDTIKNLEKAGIRAFGMKRTAIVEIKGVKIGLIGLTEWDHKLKTVADMVAKLKKDCDLVVCTMHWGEELNYKATSKQKRLAKAAISGGADLVLGSHSHVLGGIELIDGKPVVYSLGNFCFGGKSNPTDKRTMIFQQTYHILPEGGVSQGESRVIPCTISTRSNTNDYRPTPVKGGTYTEIMKKINQLSTQFEDYPVLPLEEPEQAGGEG
ncbi:MAG: CapA family protein [Candidatus Excrementavichristensenella sp.]|jgi:poly-gamma-glutamate capsule biosynthesis protein CapA/YwtB (metallophosphatase superfamily)